jgi:hypothetical protein
MRPRWQELEAEYPWLATEYFDYDKNRETAEAYNVGSGKLPCFIFLGQDGQELLRLTGEHGKAELKRVVEELRDR